MVAGEVGGVCVSVAKSFFQMSLLFALVGLGVDNEGDTVSNQEVLLLTIQLCFLFYPLFVLPM